MAIIGALDKTKHFEEFDEPLIGTGTGTITSAERKALARANLGVDAAGEATGAAADVTVDAPVSDPTWTDVQTALDDIAARLAAIPA